MKYLEFSKSVIKKKVLLFESKLKTEFGISFNGTLRYMYLTKISKYEKTHLLEKNHIYNRKNIINKRILFLNFTVESENFVKIDWFLIEI